MAICLNKAAEHGTVIEDDPDRHRGTIFGSSSFVVTTRDLFGPRGS